MALNAGFSPRTRNTAEVSQIPIPLNRVALAETTELPAIATIRAAQTIGENPGSDEVCQHPWPSPSRTGWDAGPRWTANGEHHCCKDTKPTKNGAADPLDTHLTTVPTAKASTDEPTPRRAKHMTSATEDR